MQRLSSKSYTVAQAIAAREEFNTHGALSARVVSGLSVWDSGQLSGEDEAKFRGECPAIDYVVYSYSTPIAWHTPGGGWYRVKAKFSRTTSAHQSKLYLIPNPDRSF